jgi:hypothetical protein
MLTFSGTSTIAAAHGTTLNENASSYVIGANANINIGSPGEDGTVLWHTNPGSFGTGSDGSVDVQAGALKVADGSFSVMGSGSSTIVDAGATMDMAGFTADINDLLGAGSPGHGLGNEWNQRDRRRCRQPQSWVQLASGRLT